MTKYPFFSSSIGLLVVGFILYFLVPSFRSWIHATEFRRDFSATILATYIGALLGIPAALEVDRVAKEAETQQATAQQLATQREEERQVLIASDNALERNEKLLNKLTEDIKVDRIVNYNVDPFFLEASANSRYEHIGDISLNQELEIVRSELALIHNMVLRLFESYYGVESRTSNFIEQRQGLVNATQSRIASTKKLIEPLRKRIQERSNKLLNN